MDKTIRVALFLLCSALLVRTIIVQWSHGEEPAELPPDAPMVMASDLEDEEPVEQATPIVEAQPIQLVEYMEPAELPDSDEQPEPIELKLPEWVDSSKENEIGSSIAQAFEISSYLLEPSEAPSAPEPGSKPHEIEDDIGVLLSAAGDMLTEPTPGELVAQLERAASESHGAHMLGRLIRRCHKLLESKEFIEKAAPEETRRLSKLTAWAHDARGRLRAGQGERMTALADFERAIEFDPNCLSAIHNRAVSLAEAGREREALHDFNRLIDADPNWGSTWSNRAELLLSLGEAELALSDCNHALDRARTGPPSHARLASLLDLRGRIVQQLGKPHEAARDFSEALRITPEDSTLLYHRGNVFAEVGYFEQAVEDYYASLQRNPASGEVYTALAWVLATCPREELRDPATAVEAARRARRLLGAQNERMLEASAAAHASVGDYEEAIRLQQRALLAAGDENAPGAMRTRLSLYQTKQSFVNDLPSVVTDPAVLPAGHELPVVEQTPTSR